jgi:hypothetical protein
MKEEKEDINDIYISTDEEDDDEVNKKSEIKFSEWVESIKEIHKILDELKDIENLKNMIKSSKDDDFIKKYSKDDGNLNN